MFELAKVPQTVKELYQKNGELFKKALKYTFLLSLISNLIASIPNFLMPALNTSNRETFMTALEPYANEILLFMLLLLFTYCLMLMRVHHFIHAKETNIFNDVWCVMKRYPWVFLAAIVEASAIILGYMCFIVPGIALNAFLTFYIPAVLLEHKPIREGFIYSFNLVLGNFWRTVFVLSPLFIFFLGISFLIELTVQLAKEMHWVVTVKQAMLMHIGFRIVLGTFFLPFAVGLVLLQMNDLKLRQEILKKEEDLQGKAIRLA